MPPMAPPPTLPPVPPPLLLVLGTFVEAAPLAVPGITPTPALLLPVLGKFEGVAPLVAPGVAIMSPPPPHDARKAMMTMDDNHMAINLPLSDFMRILQLRPVEMFLIPTGMPDNPRSAIAFKRVLSGVYQLSIITIMPSRSSFTLHALERATQYPGTLTWGKPRRQHAIVDFAGDGKAVERCRGQK
jgi:hypothetical protein